jgi:hypothetical protein
MVLTCGRTFARGYRLQQPGAQRHRGLTADGLAIRADGSSQVSGIGKIGPWPRSADNGRKQQVCQYSPKADNRMKQEIATDRLGAQLRIHTIGQDRTVEPDLPTARFRCNRARRRLSARVDDLRSHHQRTDHEEGKHAEAPLVDFREQESGEPAACGEQHDARNHCLQPRADGRGLLRR